MARFPTTVPRRFLERFVLDLPCGSFAAVAVRGVQVGSTPFSGFFEVRSARFARIL